MIIAVDGPTASGKGTISKQLAKYFGLPFLDTGLLYRAVGWTLSEQGGDADNAADALAACNFDGALLANPGGRSTSARRTLPISRPVPSSTVATSGRSSPRMPT